MAATAWQSLSASGSTASSSKIIAHDLMWIQGRFENGLISLNKGDWNYQFMDELFQFPDVLTHDDMVDALAYIDQLAKVAYSTHFEEDTYEVFDSVAGY